MYFFILLWVRYLGNYNEMSFIFFFIDFIYLFYKCLVVILVVGCFIV